MGKVEAIVITKYLYYLCSTMTDKKDKMFCVRTDKELIKRFKAACVKANKKASEFVREYMELTAIKYGV